ncbi:MAG: urate hydroxylase PuuD [Gammaproteobacteria bacterium]|nr:urate hydroxylase PuuD [Gammaproteobacteria bacterium]
MNPLKTIKGTLILGFVTAVVIAVLINQGVTDSAMGGLNAWSLVVWLHVFFGVIWVGLLYYFNFVQTPALAAAAADSDGPGPAAIGKYVAPLALLWFRWAALLTWLTGAAALEVMGIGLMNAFALGSGAVVIGTGAWLGTIMLFNVWVLIWPNQKKILGIVEASDEEKAKARVVAAMASRTNTFLSIPMLMCMVGYGHGLPF